MKKKIVPSLALLVLLICMLGVLSLSVSAKTASDKVIHKGKSGSLSWSIKENGEFILEGNGSLATKNIGSFVIDKYGKEFFMPSNYLPWLKYSSKIVHAKIRVKNARSLSGILSDCYNLETVDFTGTDTSETISLSCMFGAEYAWTGKTNKIKEIDLSMLDTSNVIDMTQLFWGCTNLEYVNLSGWDTSNVTQMGSMFDCCLSLKKIDGLTKFNTSNVRKTYLMFQSCKNLKKLNLSKWNTSNLYEAWGMFSNCGKLESLDVSTWDVSKIQDFYRFFYCNVNLKDIDLTKWNMESATRIDEMFGWCYKISGGITFSSEIQSYEYAFYAATINSEKPFKIKYQGKCRKTLAKNIYKTVDYQTQNLIFVNHCSKEHKYGSGKITKATLYENGSLTKECTVCGALSGKTTIKYVKTLKLSTTSYTYDGKTKTPSVTVKDSAGKVLKKGTDYTVKYDSGRKNVGTYKATITMIGNYAGTRTLTFKIDPQNISKGSIKLSSTSYTYNGNAKTPSVTVKNAAGTTLKKNTDYTVKYDSGRKNVGTYKVTITMKGNYTGTKTLTFKINPPATTVSKLTAGSKRITVGITRKSTQLTGYQIQYATSSDFTNAKTKTISSYKTTSYTVKSLSAKKTYYVRVRTYKKVGNTTYYSGWSTYKNVKTK